MTRAATVRPATFAISGPWAVSRAKRAASRASKSSGGQFVAVAVIDVVFLGLALLRFRKTAVTGVA